MAIEAVAISVIDLDTCRGVKNAPMQEFSLTGAFRAAQGVEISREAFKDAPVKVPKPLEIFVINDGDITLSERNLLAHDGFLRSASALVKSRLERRNAPERRVPTT